MDIKRCKWCGKIARGTDNMCSCCRDRYDGVHELYLTCQLIRKQSGLEYDKRLDEERWKYQARKF